jgi:hypothetical protein
MDIKFKYRSGLELPKDEHEFLTINSKKFGITEIRTYSSRFGSLDLDLFIETTLQFYVLRSFESFAKGFIGEDWLKNLGIESRKILESEMINAKYFIKAYYEVFVKSKNNRKKAVVISEMIEDVTLYAVINHHKITEELLNRLPHALVDTYGRISLGYINVESKTCQLFPDFEDNTWRFLFTPTYEGFGNFIDQYFDFKLNQMIKVESKSDFLEKFDITDEDKYKLIINAMIDR